MFTSSIRRVIRPLPTSLPTSCCHTSVKVASAAISQCKPLSTHQRRQSSSKTSIPPDGGKPAPTGKAPTKASTSSSSKAAVLDATGATRNTVSTARSTAPSARSSTGRQGRKKSREAQVAISGKGAEMQATHQSFSKQYPNLPSVPSTQHLQPRDINLSSFFALHRPISLTKFIPESVSQSAFEDIFNPQKATNNKKRHEEVIYTVSEFADSLSAYTSSFEAEENSNAGPFWKVISNDYEGTDNVRHLDSIPNLENLVSKWPSHKPPPPPQAIVDPTDTTAPAPAKSAKKRSLKQPKRTTIIVTLTEFTNPNGDKSYAQASGTPIIRVPSSNTTIDKSQQEQSFFADNQTLAQQWAAEQENRSTRQPFLQRMVLRQQRWQSYREERAVWQRESMLVISVKRQRKLKMKKHKYKKLMRRTRNERRKLNKL